MGARGDKKQYPPIGDPTDALSMYYFMLRFLEYSKILNYAKRTVSDREAYLRRFVTWCDERSLAHPADITPPIIRRYQKHLYLIRKDNGEPLSPSGQQSHLSPLRAYFRWLAKNNHILYNPAADIEMPRVPKRLPRDILTHKEADQVLNQADTTTEYGIRDRAIMEVLYSTGIRRMELVGLKINDIDYERGTLMVVHGKGDKDRMLPIGERAIGWVKKYRNEVRPELVIPNNVTSLFLSQYGEAIGVAWLSMLISKYITSADIGKTGSCHLFRHTMATAMLENGADIRYVQMMLGHARMETTQVYTHVSITKLKEVHARTHPAKAKKNTKETKGNLDKEPETKTYH